MSETVNVVIAGTPTPIILYDSNTLEAARQAGVATAAAASAASTGFAVATEVCGPITPALSGTNLSAGNTYFWPTTLEAYPRYCNLVEYPMNTAGQIAVIVAFVEGDGSLTLVSQETFYLQAATVHSIPVDILVPAGCVIGVRLISGSSYLLAGTIPNSESIWFTTGAPTTATAKSIFTTSGIKFRMTMLGDARHKATVAYDEASEDTPFINTAVKSLYIPGRVGKSTDPVTGTNDATFGLYVFNTPLPGSVGRIDSIDIFGGSVGGPVQVYLCDLVSGNLLPNQLLGTYTLTANVRNQIDIGANYVGAQYIGFFAAGSTTFRFSTGAGNYYRSATVSAIATGAPTTSATLQAAFIVSYFDQGAVAAKKPLYIVIDGNSLPAGVPGTGGTAVTTFASQLAALIPTATIVNKSVSGQNVDAMIADATTDIYPLGDQADYTTVLIFSGEPYNQMRANTSITNSIIKMNTYLEGARNTGKFDVIIVEGPGAHNTANGNPVEGTWDRVTSKDLLRAAMKAEYPNYFVDHYLDMGADPALSDYTNLTFYQPDGVHYRSAVHTLEAAAYYRLLLPII